MKKIESVSVWKNGQSKEATILNASIINDNLTSCCTFYYQLCEGTEETEEQPLTISSVLVDGNVNLSGDEYLEWDGNNEYAYSYIAEQLNLILV